MDCYFDIFLADLYKKKDKNRFYLDINVLHNFAFAYMKTAEECYEKSKNLFDFSFYSKKKHDFDRYQSCMYDRRLINITFEKFFWESGMN